MSGDWMLVGDFNEIAYVSEKKGDSRSDLNACQMFKNWINDCSLIDLSFVGTKFTWRGPQWEGHERVFKRLERALVNANWRIRFSEAKVDIFPRTNSDHYPILFNTQPREYNRRECPFCFEAMWNLHSEFKNFVKQNWER
ncbi:hypothetical protein S83_024842 [Arachis hypogaea]